MKISIKTQTGSYDITLKRGAIKDLSQSLKLNRKALIVTDDGVPELYSETVASQFDEAVVIVFPAGEKTKCFDSYCAILEKLSENEFSREDCVVAVGGGVMGDLAGFTAATYMRGIDFYNIPTTLLSQVDSSIGGKTAVDFLGYKNIVGAFYQPKAVVIDPDVLRTLDDRQFNNGLSESIKMAATSDKELFEIIENNDAKSVIDTIIERSLMIKKAVVEEDEKETGLRRVLNFGHTAGHAIETATDLGGYLHGECVSLGMLAFSSENARKRLEKVLIKNNLPVECKISSDSVLAALRHDKKANSIGVNAVFVDVIGEFKFRFVEFSELDKIVEEAYLN